MFKRIHHTCGEFRFREHFDGPHRFTTYVDGKDGEVKVEVDKAMGMLAVGGILVDAYFILKVLGSREAYKEAFSEDGKYLCISGREYVTGEDKEVWVSVDQLSRVIRENMMCRFCPGRVCEPFCWFWFSPNQRESHCIYTTHPTFRRFVEKGERYIRDFVDEEERLVRSTVKFRFRGFNSRVKDLLGNVRTRREMLELILAEMGHEVKVGRDGTLIAEKRYPFLPLEGYRIEIDKDGNGLVESTLPLEVFEGDRAELVPGFIPFVKEALFKTGHLILARAMRCLCYYFDGNIRLVSPKRSGR